MAHYYTSNEDLRHDPCEVAFDFGGQHLLFESDAGVFSRHYVDYGSRVLLESLDDLGDVKSLLDVGCGYGPIGLSLKIFHPHLKVDLVDVNARALELCQKNAARYGLTDTRVYQSNVYSMIEGEYDLILSNPPIRAGKKVVHAILEGAIAHLVTGGRLRVVIQKKQGAPSAKAKMLSVFGNCTVITKDKGYYILESCKKD